jgi:hypothetical protein
MLVRGASSGQLGKNDSVEFTLSLRRPTHPIAAEHEEQYGAERGQKDQSEDPRNRRSRLFATHEHERNERETDGGKE